MNTESTMKEFMTNDQEDYNSGITCITVNGKSGYELKGKFLNDLHNNAFDGTNGEDTVKHIEYFLRIVDQIDLPNINRDKLRVVVFPISLVGGARRWFDMIKESIDSWIDLTAKFFRKYYPPSRTSKTNTQMIRWDPTNPKFENWLALKFVNYKTMDIFTKGALWDYWKMGSDEIEPTGNESSDFEKTNHDNEQEIGEIFRIETNLFNYETPLTTGFMNGTKTYLGWTRDLGLTQEYGKNRNQSNILVNLSAIKLVVRNGQHVVGEMMDYIMEETYLERTLLETLSIIRIMNADEREELCEIHELPVCTIRRFEMIKYSFEQDEEYVAVKEDEYDDLARANKNACRAYQEIFRMMDEGWMVTRAE
ncbi:hypothetical protein Tco_0969027 [Tanacetum coccineum]